MRSKVEMHALQGLPLRSKPGAKSATAAATRSQWKQMIVYERKISSTSTRRSANEVYEITSLHVRFSYSVKKRENGVALSEPPQIPQGVWIRDLVTADSFTRTAREACSPKPTSSSRAPGMPPPSGETRSSDTIPREWVDETYHFDARKLHATLHSANNMEVEDGGRAKWYSSAVSVDAIVPPGISISMKEILAFYPHHVAWEGVKVRLAVAGFERKDVTEIQAHFRDKPDRRVTELLHVNQPNALSQWNSSSTHAYRSSRLIPGAQVEKLFSGFKVPSFADLVENLHHLPCGPDARSLTECLVWYLSIRNTFTPRLELNVLHAQALTRALRPRLVRNIYSNLDQLGLQEWRETKFEQREASKETTDKAKVEEITFEKNACARLKLDLGKEDVSLKVSVHLGRFLLFPTLMARNALCECVKAAAEVLEGKVAKRKEREGADETSWKSPFGLWIQSPRKRKQQWDDGDTAPFTKRTKPFVENLVGLRAERRGDGQSGWHQYYRHSGVDSVYGRR